MSGFIKYLSPEERAEWVEMLDEALSISGQADQAAIDAVEEALSQAERAGRTWPSFGQREWLREGVRVALRDRAKSRDRVLVSHGGALISKSARRGVTTTREDGSRSWQQTLFSEMTWEQFDDFRNGNLAQIRALTVNETIAAKLDALRILAPDSTGPQDACDRLGTTIDEVLAS